MIEKYLTVWFECDMTIVTVVRVVVVHSFVTGRPGGGVDNLETSTAEWIRFESP